MTVQQLCGFFLVFWSMIHLTHWPVNSKSFTSSWPILDRELWSPSIEHVVNMKTTHAIWFSSFGVAAFHRVNQCSKKSSKSQLSTAASWQGMCALKVRRPKQELQLLLLLLPDLWEWIPCSCHGSSQVTTKLLLSSQKKSSSETSFCQNTDQEFSMVLHDMQLVHDHSQKDTSQTCVQQTPKS